MSSFKNSIYSCLRQIKDIDFYAVNHLTYINQKSIYSSFHSLWLTRLSIIILFVLIIYEYVVFGLDFKNSYQQTIF
jgi:hypothetical protein